MQASLIVIVVLLVIVLIIAVVWLCTANVNNDQGVITQKHEFKDTYRYYPEAKRNTIIQLKNLKVKVGGSLMSRVKRQKGFLIQEDTLDKIVEDYLEKYHSKIFIYQSHVYKHEVKDLLNFHIRKKPTMENLAKYIYDELKTMMKEHNCKLIEVEISDEKGNKYAYTKGIF